MTSHSGTRHGPGRRTLLKVSVYEATIADQIFQTLMATRSIPRASSSSKREVREQPRYLTTTSPTHEGEAEWPPFVLDWSRYCGGRRDPIWPPGGRARSRGTRSAAALSPGAAHPRSASPSAPRATRLPPIACCPRQHRQRVAGGAIARAGPFSVEARADRSCRASVPAVHIVRRAHTSEPIRESILARSRFVDRRAPRDCREPDHLCSVRQLAGTREKELAPRGDEPLSRPESGPAAPAHSPDHFEPANAAAGDRRLSLRHRCPLVDSPFD